MPVVDFETDKIQLWANIGGEDIEIYRYEDDWGLNSIPTCNLYCAIGRDVETLEVAAIHDIIDEFEINLPVTVYAVFEQLATSVAAPPDSLLVGNPAFGELVASNDNGGFPDGQFTLFDGRIVGSSFRKSRNGTASLVLRCRHFLMDLEYGPTNLLTTHPQAPGNFNMAAGIMAGAQDPNFMGNTTASVHFTADNITSDLWDDAFQPWLEDVIDTPAVFEGENISASQGSSDAKIALNSFEPVDGDGYVYGVPLEIDPSFEVLNFDSAIAAIANDVSKTQLESFYGSTIWEKLTQDYASAYLFAVVPRATNALVVPFTPGLRDTWVTIDPSEYDSIAEENTLNRGIQGVVIYTGINSMTGAFGFQQGVATANKGVGGEFFSDTMTTGMIIFRDGPCWLGNAVNGQAWGQDAAFPANGVKGNAMNPGVGGAPVAGDPGQVREEAVNLWDEYARGVYLYEALKDRRKTIVGKLRFDICVGSSVELISDEEPFVAGQTGVDNVSYFGTVTRVSNIIDSEAVQAQTTIELGWVRDESENEDDSLSTDDHPLYTQTWPGAPLIDDVPAEEEPIPFIPNVEG